MRNLNSVLAQLNAERDRLSQAIAALEAVAVIGRSRKARGRGSRVLSAEARKRIADAQRKRWTAFRKKKKAA
jgi:ABC-type transporter Mla subunit MlaD